MELEQWKQKYYDQLDRLEEKEQQWEKLETLLKRTIGRMSLAAEGQTATLDRHIEELRGSIKNTINQQRLESIVDDISKVLSQLEDKQSDSSRQAISLLEQLLKRLNLPENFIKPRKKLLKKFKKSDDSQSDNLLKESLVLLKSVISEIEPVPEKAGLLDRLFKQNNSTADSSHQHTEISDDKIDTYKSFLIELLGKMDNPDSPNGKLASLKISVRDAHKKDELDKLSGQLSLLLTPDSENNSRLDQSTQPDNAPAIDHSLQPGIQELLIRLLEQLIIPAEFQDEVDKLKQRLEDINDTTDWKLLLQNVASLINSIRSHMQHEKHEFETFLQQVTDRLKTMDQFLLSETQNLQQAKSQGKEFDQQVSVNVDKIRQDINGATELSELKQNVTSKIDTISSHIQTYRESENTRLEQSQDEVSSMHSKMLKLETESKQLKQVLIEKSKQAMFDTLTQIPNRLAYEKKAKEEIARWKRFDNPLSLAIWDIDLFKNVNDTYGHRAGDKVLKAVAQLLNKRIRSTDFLSRFGGEEFVMLLPGTVQEETLRLVNDLRKQIETCGFHFHGKAVKITVSCGVSSFNKGDTLNQVFERADQALYRAKDKGRNQCVVAACLSGEVNFT